MMNYFECEPVDLLYQMFEEIDENGILFLPPEYLTRFKKDSFCFRCCLPERGAINPDSVAERFDRLYIDLEDLASFLKDNGLQNAGNLSPKRFSPLSLYQVWKTFAAPFLSGTSLKQDFRDDPASFSTEYLALGNQVLNLFLMEADDDSIRRCACDFAVAMVLHLYAFKVEAVDSMAGIRYERYRTGDDEDMEENTKKKNSRKSLVPLYVYLILKEQSDSSRPLKQVDLIRILKEYPYEISMERKALGRIIHNLEDSEIGIYTEPHKGCWYETA